MDAITWLPWTEARTSTGSGQLRYALSPESIQEFQVNRNAFAAEFGFTAGTAVNVITRGGTNNFHGSVYTFYRSQKTSAANFFDHLTPQKAFDQRVYPGFTFGGPLVKNKAFIFTSYEWTKQDAARFRSYTDNPGILGPTVTQNSYLDQLAGSNDPTLIMTAAALRGALTTTNYPTTLKLLGDNEGTFNSPTRIHNWTTRADWQISNNDSLSGRFTLFRSDADGIVETNTIAPSNGNTVFSRDYTAVTTWTHNAGANVVNQLRTQFVPNNSSLALPKDPAGTQINISGVGTFGRYRFNPFNTFQDRYQIEDTLSWSKGRHSFKFGGSYPPVNYKVINELWFGAEWSFSPGIYPLNSARSCSQSGCVCRLQPVYGPTRQWAASCKPQRASILQCGAAFSLQAGFWQSGMDRLGPLFRTLRAGFLEGHPGLHAGLRAPV